MTLNIRFWLRASALAVMAALAFPTIIVIDYWSYVQWCPASCLTHSPQPDAIPDSPYIIEEVNRKCFYHGLHGTRLLLTNLSTEEKTTIVNLPYTMKNGDTPKHDMFFEDGKIHVILLNDEDVEDKASTVFGIPVIYHWINRRLYRHDPNFSHWSYGRWEPEARVWSLAHSEVH